MGVKKTIPAREKRNEKIERKTIGLPQYIWDAIEERAERQRRPVNRQIEFIMVDYFGLDDQIVNTEMIGAAREHDEWAVAPKTATK